MHQWCYGMFLKREINAPAGPIVSSEALFVCGRLIILPVEFYKETKIQPSSWWIILEAKYSCSRIPQGCARELGSTRVNTHCSGYRVKPTQPTQPGRASGVFEPSGLGVSNKVQSWYPPRSVPLPGRSKGEVQTVARFLLAVLSRPGQCV